MSLPLSDLWFVTAAVPAHMRMLSELQVARTHASAQFQPVLTQAIQTTENHLQDALQLLAQLDQQAGISVAQLPGSIR
jgi:hypothetical protein